MADLNPAWNPKPDEDGASRAGVRIGQFAAGLLMDPDEPGITHMTQLVDGLAEALLTFIGHAPADLREHVFTTVVREMARSRGQVFEAVDAIRGRLQSGPETPQ